MPSQLAHWRTRAVRLLLAAQIVVLSVVLNVPPARATDLFTELHTFPGTVLLPTPDQEPFAQLEPWRVELSRPRAGVTPTVPRGRYLVQYREQEGSFGSAQVGGALGRDDLDQTLAALAARSFRRCPADASYCVENVAGQDGAAPASEVFRGLTVNDGVAVVEHVVCCGGHYWSLTWYDAARDMTYTMVLVGTLADRYGSTIAPDNASVAAMLAGIAGQLAPLE